MGSNDITLIITYSCDTCCTMELAKVISVTETAIDAAVAHNGHNWRFLHAMRFFLRDFFINFSSDFYAVST